MKELSTLEDERRYAQEHAMRQVAHLEREIRYGYPPATVRHTRGAANAAVTAYFAACEAVNREARKRAKARRAAA